MKRTNQRRRIAHMIAWAVFIGKYTLGSLLAITAVCALYILMAAL